MGILGRIVSAGALGLAGRGLMRRGMAMRDARKRAPAAALAVRSHSLVSRVQSHTRGATPVRLLSKQTAAGQSRRLALAQRFKAARNPGRPIVATGGAKFAQHMHGVAANRQQAAMTKAAQARVRSIHSRTRAFKPNSYSKRTTHGRLGRQFLAEDLRQARKGPHTSASFGYDATKSPKTLDLRRK